MLETLGIAMMILWKLLIVLLLFFACVVVSAITAVILYSIMQTVISLIKDKGKL